MAPEPALPPLTALRSFEAVARHGSVTRAARELGVTQTAVSHQLATLERFLGEELVRRVPAGVTCTPAGQAWADALRDVFDRLRAANRRLRRAPGSRTVAVTVMPSFGTRWLVPRLGRFLAAHPELDVRVSSTERVVDLAVEGFDLGLRYGRHPGAGVEALPLFEDRWVVVCTPAVRRAFALRSPEDLARAPLLCDDEPGAWAAWLARTAPEAAELPRSTELSDSAHVVDAAVRGAGVALARLSLAADELRDRRLVRPFPQLELVPTGRRYFLAAPPGPSRPEVDQFRAWVEAEIAELSRFTAALPRKPPQWTPR